MCYFQWTGRGIDSLPLCSNLLPLSFAPCSLPFCRINDLDLLGLSPGPVTRPLSITTLPAADGVCLGLPRPGGGYPCRDTAPCCALPWGRGQAAGLCSGVQRRCWGPMPPPAQPGRSAQLILLGRAQAASRLWSSPPELVPVGAGQSAVPCPKPPARERCSGQVKIWPCCLPPARWS